MDDSNGKPNKSHRQSTRTIRKNAELSRMFIKEEVRARCKKVGICKVSLFALHTYPVKRPRSNENHS